MAQAGNIMAQDMNSAYFTDDYKYRHVMNPAYGNEQGYAAVPILGNMNMRLQGNLGVGDLFFANPDFGKKPGAKKTTTFMHPGISVDEALSGFNTGYNNIILDLDLPIASVGFQAFGGYNTVELKERTHFGLSMPYDFFKFAKNLTNQDYQFDDLGMRGWSYVELGFGHSHLLFDNLRVGAKVKLLFGIAYADFSMDGVHADLQSDKWVISGKAKGELNMKGAKFKQKEEDYKTRYKMDAKGNYVIKDGEKVPETYNRIDGIDIDGGGLGGFGLGLDLGGVYEFKDCSVDWLDGLKVSLALTDIGFISWSNGIKAESSGDPFEFSGFNGMDLSSGEGKTTFDDKKDEVMDDLQDFANLQDQGSTSGSTTALATTLRFGLEYPLPVYDKISFGSLFSRRFDGDYSWTEERISANYKPLNWVDGGINVAFTSFCTTMGWVVNFHPVGMNVFFGMDHMIGKTGASMIPLDSNVSFNFGLNVAWGGKKKSNHKFIDKVLTF